MSRTAVPAFVSQASTIKLFCHGKIIQSNDFLNKKRATLEKIKSKLNKARHPTIIRTRVHFNRVNVPLYKNSIFCSSKLSALLWLKRLKMMVSCRNIAGYNWALVLNTLLVGRLPLHATA